MLERISRTAGIIFVLWLFLYGSFAVMTPPLLDGSDALHAEIAREMIVRHDALTMYANGIRYGNDAPLMYWSIAANMRIFGIATGTARLPLALCTLLAALLTGMLARRMFWSERSAVYAGVGLLLTAGLFGFTRMLNPAAMVCLWSTAALYCLWRAEMDPPEYSDDAALWPCLGFAAACALMALTASPASLALPILIALFYVLVTRGIVGAFKRVWRLHPIRGLFVFLAIAAPPYLLIARAHGESPLQTVRMTAPHGGTVSWALVPVLLLVSLVPWGAFLFNAMGVVPWRRALNRSTATLLDSEENATVLLVIGACVPVVFSLVTRQWIYLLPSLPCFILLIARWLDREGLEVEALMVPSPLFKAGVRVTAALLVVGCVVALACLFLLARTRNESAGIDAASALGPVSGWSLWHLHSLNADAIGLFRESLQLLAASALVGTVGAWWFRRNHQPHYATMALAIGAFGLLVAGHKAFSTVGPNFTSQQVATALAPQATYSDLIVVNGEYGAATSLAFYLQRDDVHVLRNQAPNAAPPDASLVVTLESLRAVWHGKGRIFLWTTPETAPSLPGNVFVVAQGGGKEILSNIASKGAPALIEKGGPIDPKNGGVDKNRFPDFAPIAPLPDDIDIPSLPVRPDEPTDAAPAATPSEGGSIPRGADGIVPRAIPPDRSQSSTPR